MLAVLLVQSKLLRSFLELYNEETTDLLAVGDRQDQKLRIMEDRSGVVIQVCQQHFQSTLSVIKKYSDKNVEP